MKGVDEDQWVNHYRALEKPLYNLVYRWLWDEAESLDVVQEAFMRCWHKRAQIRPDGFRAFVYQTALNLASNLRRRKKIWQFVSLKVIEDLGEDQKLDSDMLSRPVMKAVDELPEQLKRVLLLNEVAGMNYREIASVLGIKEGTVGSRRSRAIATLRERLKIKGVCWNED